MIYTNWLFAILMMCMCPALHAETAEEVGADANLKRIRLNAIEKSGIGNYGQFDRVLGPDERLVIYVSEKETAFELIGNSGTSAINYGHSEIKNGMLSIKWHLPIEITSGVSCEYVVVEWSGCAFLVDKSELLRFCHKAKNDRRSIQQLYPFKCNGEVKDLEGIPKIPNEYVVYWDLDSIDAKIVHTEKAERVQNSSQRVFVQRVVLDKGKRSHIYEGMKMQTIAVPSVDLTIVEVRAESAIGMIRHIGRRPKLGIGAIFTTDF